MTVLQYLVGIAMGAAIAIHIPMVTRSANVMLAAAMGNVPFFFRGVS